jgi:hypothetical protein
MRNAKTEVKVSCLRTLTLAMLDPLTTTSAILALTARCAITIKDINDGVQNYHGALQTIANIHNEADTMEGALISIESCLESNSKILEEAGLMDRFDGTIAACYEVVKKLERSMTALTKGRQWKQRLRIMWNENEMRALADEMRTKQASLSLLLQALNM